MFLLRFASYVCLPMLLLGQVAQARTKAPQLVTVHFVAKVNGAPFACNQSYRNVGKNKVTWQPQDLRFYVGDMALLRADGTRIPMTFVADGTWQQKDVALLDFENRTGACQNGTPQVNTQVRGTVEDATGAVGLAFVLGVPFAKNHGDASTQDPPLDQAGMFWGWQMGYKFLSVEGKVNDKQSYTAHLGSTGCQMPAPGKVSSCAAENRVQVHFARFDPARNVVVADIGKLLGDNVMGAPVANAPANGCMAEKDNAHCVPLFAHLGLSTPDGRPIAAGGAQDFFAVE